MSAETPTPSLLRHVSQVALIERLVEVSECPIILNHKLAPFSEIPILLLFQDFLN